MEKLNKTIRIKLLFFLFFTNIIVFIIASSMEEGASPTSLESSFEREGYSKFRLNAKLFTSFEPQKPISIISKDKKLFIPFALLLDEVSSNNEETFIQERTSTDYIVYIPEKFISQLINKKRVDIIPYGKKFNFKKKRVKTYEINI